MSTDEEHDVNAKVEISEISTECIADIKKLDKFYTRPEISIICLKNVGKMYEWSAWDLIVEPSAGNGSFLKNIPSSKKIGIDILPEDESIAKKDFFEYTPPPSISKNILVVGNPPFGRVCSLAIKFFNHASEWASVIAFIVPRTFRRISVQNKLAMNFHLVFDEDIPLKPCAFTPPMMAKCCFQIWEKRVESRCVIRLPTTHSDWGFLELGSRDERGQPTVPTTADFVVRAYGHSCGEIKTRELDLLRPKSWHWIKANICKDLLVARLRSLDYSISLNTARQNSIGRAELVKLYTEKYN
jgi:hypothetical protein